MTSDANFTVIFNSLLDEPLLAFPALFTRSALTGLKLHGFQALAHDSFFSHPLGPFLLRIVMCNIARLNEQSKTEGCLGTDEVKVITIQKNSFGSGLGYFELELVSEEYSSGSLTLCIRVFSAAF